MIKQLRDYLPTNVLDQIYKMHGRSHLDYCDFIYHIPKLRERKKDQEMDWKTIITKRVTVMTQLKTIILNLILRTSMAND